MPKCCGISDVSDYADPSCSRAYETDIIYIPLLSDELEWVKNCLACFNCAVGNINNIAS